MYKRLRPLIEKERINGGPLSCMKLYCNHRLKSYREKHKEFDQFLLDVEKCIKAKELSYCGNIIKFINYEGETNWIAPNNNIFQALVTLYNYDFSSEQAVEYIKECYSIYQKLLCESYRVNPQYEIIVEKSTYSGQYINHYKYWVHLEDIYQPEPCFKVKYMNEIPKQKSLLNYYIDLNVELRSEEGIYGLILMLFENYQGCKLKTHIYECVQREFESNKKMQ